MGFSYPHFQRDSIIAVIERVRAGEDVTAILGRGGLPSRSTFYRAIRSTPELELQYAAALAERGKLNPSDDCSQLQK
jgi:hypothetical protein